MPRPTRERRAVPRTMAAGRVLIRFTNPVENTLQAQLVDRTVYGFRAVHESKQMVPGIEVSFQHGDESGQARVIWTHILGEHRESGFLLL